MQPFLRRLERSRPIERYMFFLHLSEEQSDKIREFPCKHPECDDHGREERDHVQAYFFIQVSAQKILEQTPEQSDDTTQENEGNQDLDDE